MELFDLHCDTLYRACDENSGLFNDSFHISYNKTDGISPYIQCMAVWIPDEYRNEKAMALFRKCRERLRDELDGTDIAIIRSAQDIDLVCKSGGRGVILTVEGGGVLGGRLENVGYLADCGVRMMTLTWNGACETGDGVGVQNARGLTSFGKSVVAEMERRGVIADVSHASEALFYDVAEIAAKPFVASHSNSRTICPHKRNLTDEQFSIIAGMGGIVGLNLSKDFLREDGDSAKMSDVLKHAEHFLSLGGEKTLAIGTDFDGADIPADMTGIESMSGMFDLFLKHYSEELVRDIFFNNAVRFMGSC